MVMGTIWPLSMFVNGRTERLLLIWRCCIYVNSLWSLSMHILWPAHRHLPSEGNASGNTRDANDTTKSKAKNVGPSQICHVASPYPTRQANPPLTCGSTFVYPKGIPADDSSSPDILYSEHTVAHRHSFYSEHAVGWRFNFPRYILSRTYCQLTRIHACTELRQGTQTVPLTKSHKSSFIFNSRHAWWDIHRSSQAAWHNPCAGDRNMKWRRRRLNTPLETPPST